MTTGEPSEGLVTIILRHLPDKFASGVSDGDISNAGGESCLLYTSDAADERSSVDLGGRRIIKKKKN